MLVLSRRVGEEIVLPSLGVTITILKNGRNQVRLGVAAPQETRVVRGELVDDKRKNGFNPVKRVTASLRPRQTELGDCAGIDISNCSINQAS